MLESKQVRVDNWGIYFLQRLQVFFSKTDYCDLTLQFEGNVQLKVHRLVMCACTEYFTFLEKTCPALEENTIMMPQDLQADVIVPIVNFMYTGMLEFHMSIFERLYKAADLMNITVLTKLLDAQRAHANYKMQKKKVEAPHIWNLQGPKVPSKAQKPSTEMPSPLPGRKLPVWKRKNAPNPHSASQFSEQRCPPDPLSMADSAPKPTRFEWPEDDLPSISLMDTSFEDISYTSKPLLTKQEEIRAGTSFDDVRKNTNDLNRDESDYSEGSQKRKLETSGEKSSPKRVKLNDKENKEATISIKSSNGADLDHTKIVSEILKKYPQLVKKNKNIRLKIMASGNKTVVEQPVHPPVKTPKMKIQVEAAKAKLQTPKPVTKPKVEKRSVMEEGPWVCTKCNEGEAAQEFVLYYLYRKHMTDIHNEAFDTRLCKYCGQWCGKHSLMMYHLYTKHGLKPPNSYNFPKCDQCPYIAQSTQKLAQHKAHHDSNEMQCINCHLAFTSQQTLTSHIQITGHLNRSGNNNYDCQYCTKRLQSTINLFSHIKNSHLKEAKRDGIVILDEAEDTDDGEEDDVATQKDKVKIISNVKVPPQPHQPNTTIQQTAQLEAHSEAETLTNITSGIATNLGLVDIVVLNDNQQYILQQQDGHTGQPEFIIPDLATGENHFAGQVITTQHSTVLPQGMIQTSTGDITSTDELVMVLTDHDYQDEQEGATADNSNIVVLYSHPVDGQQGQFITSQGNLLVNSQTGMLEIRNDAIATTSANQMIVNTSVDTSESIESIQREIQSHREMKQEPYYEEPKETEVQIPQEAPEEVLTEQPEEPSPQTEEVEANNVTADQEVAPENSPLEESLQEQETPVEAIEENGKASKEVVQKEVEIPQEECNVEEERPSNEQSDDKVDGAPVAVEEPMEIDDVEKAATEEDPMVKQASNESAPVESNAPPPEATNTTENEVQSIDVPPTEKKDYVEEDPLEASQSSEQFVFNDPNKLGDVEGNDSQQSTIQMEENVSEAMEVDGKADKDQQEGGEEGKAAVDEVDTEAKEKEVQEQVPEVEKSKETEQETSVEDPQTDLPDQQPPETETLECEYQQPSEETDNSQYNEEEEDENSQSSQGTTRSRETAVDSRSQVNIDQVILEDWEDTDSQQSEKQRTAMKQAAENVNKLMDDWEEEDDEEDKKDGD